MIYLVPDIHDLQTGGNVYNRRMIEALRPELSVRVISWAPVDSPLPFLDAPETGIIVVDSLLAHHPDAIWAVREAHPTSTLILLAHYLHCIDPSSDDPKAATAERAALDAFDGAVTTSRFAKQVLAEEGVSTERIKVAPPGLDERYRGPLPIRSGRAVPRMLTVANLLPEKGLRSFMKVLRELRSVPWRWVLVGDFSLDRDYAESVVERVQEMGLSDRVTYTGVVSPDTLRAWYDWAGLFVLPSRFETCSLSMREAMARGLPVVGYRVGGVAENFGDASAGCLVPPGNAAALRAALRTLLTDPMTRRQKGRAARRRSRVFPTWEEAAGRFRETLATLQTRPDRDT